MAKTLGLTSVPHEAVFYDAVRVVDSNASMLVTVKRMIMSMQYTLALVSCNVDHR